MRGAGGVTVTPSKHRAITAELATYVADGACVLCADGKYLRVVEAAVVHTSIGPSGPNAVCLRNGHEVAMWCCPTMVPGRAPMFTALRSDEGVLTQTVAGELHHVMPIIDLSRCRLCDDPAGCTVLTRVPEAGEALGLGVPYPLAAAMPNNRPAAANGAEAPPSAAAAAATATPPRAHKAAAKASERCAFWAYLRTCEPCL